MSDLTQFIREFGFPIFVCVWLMWMYQKERREHAKDLKTVKDLLHKLVVLNAAIARTLDVEPLPGVVSLPPEGER